MTRNNVIILRRMRLAKALNLAIFDLFLFINPARLKYRDKNAFN